MAVEAIVSKDKKAKVKREYPYMGEFQSSGMIVFFCAKSTGIAIVGGEVWPSGEYSTGWQEDQFQPLSPSESVTLRNV